jgi:hypothetical protein
LYVDNHFCYPYYSQLWVLGTKLFQEAGFKSGCRTILARLHVDDCNTGIHEKTKVAMLTVCNDLKRINSPSSQNVLMAYPLRGQDSRKSNLEPLFTRLQEALDHPFILSFLPPRPVEVQLLHPFVNKIMIQLFIQ